MLVHNLLSALYHLGIGPGLPLYIFFWSFFPALLFLKYKSLYPPVLLEPEDGALAGVGVGVGVDGAGLLLVPELGLKTTSTQ